MLFKAILLLGKVDLPFLKLNIFDEIQLIIFPMLYCRGLHHRLPGSLSEPLAAWGRVDDVTLWWSIDPGCPRRSYKVL